MLRSRQREQRKQRILNAAEALIRDTGGTDFSMLTLAQHAEVSPVTPYNLFESKAGVMYTLLNRSMDQVIVGAQEAAFKRAEPMQRVLEAASAAAEVFAGDPLFYRPLYQFLLGVRDPVHRPRFLDRALDYWKGSLEAAAQAGLLAGPIDRDELARELLIHFAGVLDLWVQDELDDDGFRGQIVFGSCLLLLAIADEPSRPALLRHLRGAKRKLPRRFTFSGAVQRPR